MRISDWSSDVCSSELRTCPTRRRTARTAAGRRSRGGGIALGSPAAGVATALRWNRQSRATACSLRSHPHPALRATFSRCAGEGLSHGAARWAAALLPFAGEGARREDEGASEASRSEEHTSELQSLMSISYAVVCLKNNTK